MTEPFVVVRTVRLVVHHPAGSDPFVAPGTWRDLSVVRGSDATEVGRIGVRVEPEEPTVEVAVTVHAAAAGQGYGSEALGAVVTHALTDRGLLRVVAFAAATDEPRRRLFARIGLLPVAADGDDLVYLRRGTGPVGRL